MARLNLTVPEKKKKKWEQAAKDHPEAGGNISALVRHSVEKEISDSSSTANHSEEVLTKLGNLGDQLTEVTQRMESMESRLSSIESQSTDEPDIGDLTGEVFDILPDEKPGTTEWISKRKELIDELQAVENGLIDDESESVRKSRYGWEGNIEGLAQGLGKPRYMVQKAIDKLRENTHLVRSTDDGRYYKVD